MILNDQVLSTTKITYKKLQVAIKQTRIPRNLNDCLLFKFDLKEKRFKFSYRLTGYGRATKIEILEVLDRTKHLKYADPEYFFSKTYPYWKYLILLAICCCLLFLEAHYNYLEIHNYIYYTLMVILLLLGAFFFLTLFYKGEIFNDIHCMRLKVRADKLEEYFHGVNDEWNNLDMNWEVGQYGAFVVLFDDLERFDQISLGKIEFVRSFSRVDHKGYQGAILQKEMATSVVRLGTLEDVGLDEVLSSDRKMLQKGSEALMRASWNSSEGLEVDKRSLNNLSTGDFGKRKGLKGDGNILKTISFGKKKTEPKPQPQVEVMDKKEIGERHPPTLQSLATRLGHSISKFDRKRGLKRSFTHAQQPTLGNSSPTFKRTKTLKVIKSYAEDEPGKSEGKTKVNKEEKIGKLKEKGEVGPASEKEPKRVLDHKSVEDLTQPKAEAKEELENSRLASIDVIPSKAPKKRRTRRKKSYSKSVVHYPVDTLLNRSTIFLEDDQSKAGKSDSHLARRERKSYKSRKLRRRAKTMQKITTRRSRDPSAGKEVASISRRSREDYGGRSSRPSHSHSRDIKKRNTRDRRGKRKRGKSLISRSRSSVSRIHSSRGKASKKLRKRKTKKSKKRKRKRKGKNRSKLSRSVSRNDYSGNFSVGNEDLSQLTNSVNYLSHQKAELKVIKPRRGQESEGGERNRLQTSIHLRRKREKIDDQMSRSEGSRSSKMSNSYKDYSSKISKSRKERKKHKKRKKRKKSDKSSNRKRLQHTETYEAINLNNQQQIIAKKSLLESQLFSSPKPRNMPRIKIMKQENALDKEFGRTYSMGGKNSPQKNSSLKFNNSLNFSFQSSQFLN